MKKNIALLVVLFVVQVGLVCSQNLLINPGFDDPVFDNQWKTAKLSGGDGTIVPAGSSNAYSGHEACRVTTTLSNTNFGKFGLKSLDYNTSSNVFTVKVMAKTDAAGVSANIGFKFQIAAVTASGTKYFVSGENKLTDSYQEFTFTKDATSLGVDFNTVRVVLQCAGYVGNYYFDDAVLDDGSSSNNDGEIVPVKVTPMTKISTTEKVVAFTFDDGPDAQLSKQIADLFIQYGGRATFFNKGNNLAGNEEVVSQILNDGHEIGNHSMTHARIPDYVNDADVINEIVGFQDLYQSTFDYTPKLFRAPFLDYGQIRNGDTTTPDEDNRIGGVLVSENLKAINARLYANDASATTTAAQVEDKIQNNIQPGDIILCHERSHTLEAMQTLLPVLAGQGYRFVTVSELLREEEGWQTVLPANAKIAIEGSKYISNNSGELLLHRHSDAVYSNTTQVNLFNPVKARTASGIVVNFKTASPKVNVKFKIREGNIAASTFGVFQNNEFSGSQDFSFEANKDVLVELTSNHPGQEVLYSITLPIWTDVSFRGLELEPGFELTDIEPTAKPVYVAYGNSITHGRGQDGAYQTYPFLVSRMFDWQLFNLAVGGGKTSQVMAEMIRDDFEKIDVLTVLIGYNDYNGEGVTAETYKTRCANFLNTVREKHSNTEIFCITMTYTPNLVSETSGISGQDFRNAMQEVVDARIESGDAKIYLIAGDEISSDTNLTDAVHFTIEGASDFADELFLKMEPVLSDNPTTAVEGVSFSRSAIFPNPTSHSIEITDITPHSELVVRNLSGKTIKSIYVGDSNMHINLSDLSSGVFLVTYQRDGKRITEKVIKKI